MKSREEYQASIFAKRDALLAKRKKRISQAAAVMSIAVCFAVAFAFLPKKLGKKLSTEVFPQITDNAVMSQAPTPEASTAQLLDEAYTFYSSYPKYFGAKKHSEKAEAAANPAVEEFTQAATQIHLPNQETEIAQEVEETTARGFGGFRPEMWDDDGLYTIAAHTKPEGAPDYATEEIEEKAKTYLSDELAAKIINKHTMVTVRHFATPPDYYVVWFYTDDKQIKVTLNSYTLELIETAETNLSDGSDAKTTPAYIPTTAKSAMTTAAPEYRPQ